MLGYLFYILHRTPMEIDGIVVKISVDKRAHANYSRVHGTT